MVLDKYIPGLPPIVEDQNKKEAHLDTVIASSRILKHYESKMESLEGERKAFIQQRMSIANRNATCKGETRFLYRRYMRMRNESDGLMQKIKDAKPEIEKQEEKIEQMEKENNEAKRKLDATYQELEEKYQYGDEKMKTLKELITKSVEDLETISKRTEGEYEALLEMQKKFLNLMNDANDQKLEFFKWGHEKFQKMIEKDLINSEKAAALNAEVQELEKEIKEALTDIFEDEDQFEKVRKTKYLGCCI